MVGKKVLYKFPNDIASKLSQPSCRKLMIYVLPPKWPITQMAIARRPDPPPKNSSISLHVVTHLCQFMGQNSEIWGGQKNSTTF